MVKPSYILHMTYPMAIVITKIHSPAVAMSAPRSMFLAVCDKGKGRNGAEGEIKDRGEDEGEDGEVSKYLFE
jgi:hypothetical protein